MAAKILDDVLNEDLSTECIFTWLSLCKNNEEINALMNHYGCNQIEFISYILNFLREQTSRIFQSSCSVETPRKNSQLRMMKNLHLTPDASSPLLKSTQKQTPDPYNLDLESLQSFPSLSSGSIKAKSCDKQQNKTPEDSPSKNKSKENLINKKARRIKLFSEQPETPEAKGPEYDVAFLEDSARFNEKENRFAVSTPKMNSKDSIHVADYFNSMEKLRQNEISPQYQSKQRWKKDSNRSDESVMHDSRHNNSSGSNLSKSRSFGGDSSHRSKDHKSNARMSLGDFILNDSSPGENKRDKKSKVRKRINPTLVKVEDNQMHNSHNFSFDDRSESIVDVKRNLRDERYLLKKECEMLSEQFEGKNDIEDVRFIKTRTSPKTQKQTDPELVTLVKELKILALIYSYLINENYCQNIMIELCFIVSLLVIQDYDKKEFETDIKDLSLDVSRKLLNSVHNCVYFAVEMLWLQRNILLLLNLAALKLLSENNEIEKFNPDLKDFLLRVYNEKKAREECRRRNAISKSRMQGNVSFQYETDNRENFTSDNSFHSFRKQRDLFYNILAVWEANHLSSGWVFSVGLGSKIRTLLSTSSDPINFLHLAKLFRNQLIISCCGENQSEEETNEEILQLLPSADPNKISRLRARLTSTPKNQGPCPLPDFTGHQEFFKEFILCISYSLFHQYLKNSFCDEIFHLNDTEFSSETEDDGEYSTSFDEQTQDRYLHLVNILRLLAKFLGFVEFLPYRCEKQYTDRVLNLHCSVRQNVLPLFDLESCLKTALTKHKLTLTIPWIVSYLAMIDACSARLNAYTNVWKLLILIYKNLKTCKSAMNSLYLKLTLGWLFQLPNFPADFFYSAIMDSTCENFTSFEDFNKGLNASDLVRENVLYAVCPYLNEINVILSMNAGCSVRHIRPVTTQGESFSNSQASRQIELRLEESFLHNQSSSTRKTVEFVIERVASVGIKHLIHNIIPKIKESALNDIDKCNPSSVKQAESEAEKIADRCYNELAQTCEKSFWELCCSRSGQAVRALLSNDLPEVVIETCIQIVTREAAERVRRWTQSHITLAMISKEFTLIANKKFNRKQNEIHNISTDSINVSCSKGVSSKESHRLPPEGKGIDHSAEAWPASETLITVRELIWKISEESIVNSQEIESTLDGALKSLKHRADMIPVAEKTLYFLLVDLLIVASIHSDSGIHAETMKKFVTILKYLNPSNYPSSNLERIICPRNVAMINSEVKNKEKAWCNLGKLFLKLIDVELLTKDQVEEQLVSFLRQTWEKYDYIYFTKLVTHIFDNYTNSEGCDKFSLLLEWLIDTVKEMDETKDDFSNDLVN